MDAASTPALVNLFLIPAATASMEISMYVIFACLTAYDATQVPDQYTDLQISTAICISVIVTSAWVFPVAGVVLGGSGELQYPVFVGILAILLQIMTNAVANFGKLTSGNFKGRGIGGRQPDERAEVRRIEQAAEDDELEEEA